MHECAFHTPLHIKGKNINFGMELGLEESGACSPPCRVGRAGGVEEQKGERRRGRPSDPAAGQF